MASQPIQSCLTRLRNTRHKYGIYLADVSGAAILSPRAISTVTLGFSAKGSSDFFQSSLKGETVEQRRVQVTM